MRTFKLTTSRPCAVHIQQLLLQGLRAADDCFGSGPPNVTPSKPQVEIRWIRWISIGSGGSMSHIALGIYDLPPMAFSCVFFLDVLHVGSCG